MGNIGMKVLFLVLLYDQFIECTRQVLMVTPPPSAEVLRRSRKAATTDIRDGGIIPIRNCKYLFPFIYSSVVHLVKKLSL